MSVFAATVQDNHVWGASVLPDVLPVPKKTVNVVSLSNNQVVAGAIVGTIVGLLMNTTAGEAFKLTDPTGYFAVDQNGHLVVQAIPEIPGAYNLVYTEGTAGDGYTNTPKANALQVQVTVAPGNTDFRQAGNAAQTAT